MPNNRINILKYLLLIPVFVFFYFIWSKDDEIRDKEIERTLIAYPLIYETGKDYRGIVTEFSIGKKHMGGMGIYVTLSDGQKFVIGSSSNTTYKNKDLRDYIQTNDSIYYNHKTYEFFIYKKDGEKLYFKLYD